MQALRTSLWCATLGALALLSVVLLPSGASAQEATPAQIAEARAGFLSNIPKPLDFRAGALSCITDSGGRRTDQPGVLWRCNDRVTPELFGQLRNGQLQWFPQVRVSVGDTLICETDLPLRAGGVLGVDPSSLGNEPNYYCSVAREGQSTFTGYAHLGTFGGLGDRQPIIFQGSIDAQGNAQIAEGSGEIVSEAQEDQDKLDAGATDLCSYTEIETWPYCLGQGIASIFLTFTTFLLGIAGVFLNFVVVKGVFEFSLLVGNSPGLLSAWGILRDIGNMLLLFGFIFIGLAMILDLHSYPAKKTLPRLIIFAILMNFSLFAAEAVIDTANGLSSALYNQANTNPCITTQASGGEDIDDCAITYGLSGHMMESTGISAIFGLEDNPAAGGGTNNPFDLTIPTLLMLSLFSLIAAVVMLAAGIMLAIRAVVLTFLMVTAPLGFAALAIPPLEKVGKEWWNRLLHQAFFAPILILLLLVSLKITDSFAGSIGGGTTNLANALSQQNSGIMGVILVFALVIGFLVASLVSAKKFGAMGAEFAIKAGSRVGFGAAGWAGRNTIGAGAYNLGKGLRKTYFGQTAFGGAVVRGIDRGAKKSFDLRATGVGKLAGLDIGKPGKDAAKGYKGTLEAGATRRKEYADSLEMSKEEKETEKSLKSERKGMTDRFGKAQAKRAKDIEEKKEDLKKYTPEERADLERQLAEAEADSGRFLAAGNSAGLKEATDRAVAIRSTLDSFEESERRDRAALERLETRKREAEEEFEDELARIKDELEKNDPKARYAKDLQNLNRTAPHFIFGKSARAKAAKDILKDLDKSENQKILDALKGVSKDLAHMAEHDDDHGDGDKGGGDDHSGDKKDNRPHT